MPSATGSSWGPDACSGEEHPKTPFREYDLIGTTIGPDIIWAKVTLPNYEAITPVSLRLDGDGNRSYYEVGNGGALIYKGTISNENVQLGNTEA